MAKKIGDVPIAILIFIFVVSSFSLFFIGADQELGISSGIVGESLGELDNEDSEVKGLMGDFTTKTDETGTFRAQSETSMIDERGADSAGLLNLVSKNIIVRLFNVISEKIPGFNRVFAFIIGLITITISVLFLRFFLGESKV